jgi:hypothetical protein
MSITAYLVWLLLLVATAKMPSEEAVRVAGTKQNLGNLLISMANKCSSFLRAKYHVGEVKKSFCAAGTSPLSFNNFEMSSST